MLRFALADDDPKDRETLRAYLEQYRQESGEALEVTVYTDGDELVEQYKSQFDLILLDVQMQFLDGMAAAREIRRVDREVIIIFITNMAQYAIQGYAVDALDYVLKPVSYFAFAKSMGRALERLRRRRRRYLSVSSKSGTQRVDCARVYYIEADGHSLSYYTADGRLSGTGTMKEVEESLAGGWFFRCGKGLLVNLEHVEGVTDGDAVVHGTTVQVSRSRRKEFLAAFNRYINEVGQ